jgi:hypothetical protein
MFEFRHECPLCGRKYMHADEAERCPCPGKPYVFVFYQGGKVVAERKVSADVTRFEDVRDLRTKADQAAVWVKKGFGRKVVVYGPGYPTKNVLSFREWLQTTGTYERVPGKKGLRHVPLGLPSA